tara:strand:+ start:432 stop:671 length:240 start_codon:yes stop_codon:yes gene_type:complete
MSQLYEEVMAERFEKQESLLEVPRKVESIQGIIQLLEDQIDELQSAQEESQKLKSRFREYVLGGIVGAVISLFFTMLFA